MHSLPVEYHVGLYMYCKCSIRDLSDRPPVLHPYQSRLRIKGFRGDTNWITFIYAFDNGYLRMEDSMVICSYHNESYLRFPLLQVWYRMRNVYICINIWSWRMVNVIRLTLLVFYFILEKSDIEDGQCLDSL